MHQGACPRHATWTANALLPFSLPISQRLHTGSHTSRSYRLKTFLHLLGHLYHLTMGRSRNSRYVVIIDIETRRERGRRGGERTLGPPADSGRYKNGSAPPFCLPLYLPFYLTYLSLFISILKDSRPLVLYIDNPSYRYLL